MWIELRALLLFFYILQQCQSVTVNSGNDELNNSSLATLSPTKHNIQESVTYRVSAPKPKKPSNRVPAHLQDIPTGYVNDEADEVIHIIEPPQHFQQLKHLINHKGVAAVLEHQRKVRIIRPQSIASLMPPSPAPAAMTNIPKTAALVTAKQTKVKGLPLFAKVDRPLGVSHKKPAVATIALNAPALTLDSDLLTQETNIQPEHYLPMNILASVRKTERLLQSKKRGQMIPHAMQRIKSKKTHTVLWEKGFEHKKFSRGKEHRMGGGKIQRNVRRVRTKRDLAASSHRSTTKKGGQMSHITNDYDGLKGIKLLQHINELLKNATVYLPDDSDVKNTFNRDNATAKTFNMQMAETKALLNRYGIIENSINATDVLMSGILLRKNHTNSSSVAYRCDDVTSNNSNNDKYQGLQHKLNCVRQQLQSMINEERTHGDESNATTTLQAGRFSRNSRMDDNLVRTHANNNSATLLYNDVMANIRNMLQSDNLRSLLLDEDALLSSHLDPLSSPRFIPLADADGLHDFDDLNQYLSELQTIVATLPAIKPQENDSIATASTTELSLNSHEFISNRTNRSIETGNTDWYLINDEGRIYETHLSDQLKPAATIFHRFPDIPNAVDYLRNRTGGMEHSSTFEIL